MSDFSITLASFVEGLRDSLHFPVDVEALVASLGLGLIRVPSRDQSHPRLVTNGARTEILLPQDRPESGPLSPRDRFSIAHELGHYIIWETHRQIPKGREDYWYHEALCDRFAGRLLLPSPVVQRAITRVGNDHRKWLGVAKVLAQYAHVSWHVAAFRLSEETRKIFYFSAVRSKNRRGFPVWQIMSSTLDSGERQRVGKRAFFPLDSNEGQWFEELPGHRLTCNVMDLRFPTLAIRDAALVAYRKESQIRFCTVSGSLEDVPNRKGPDRSS